MPSAASMTQEQIPMFKERRIQFVCSSYMEMGRELFPIQSGWYRVEKLSREPYNTDLLWTHSGTEQPIVTKLDLFLTDSYPLSKITFTLIFYTVFLNKDISLPERKSLIQSSQCWFLAHVYL